MTIMPDVVAKTRVFDAFEKFLNSKTVRQLEHWRDDLKALPFSQLIKKELGGALPLGTGDSKHLRRHVFGLGHGDHRYWEEDSEMILSEGFARTIELMLRKDPTKPIGANGSNRRRKALPVEFWWLCPSTYAVRMIVLPNDRQVTSIVLTPPKPDHPHHYARYQELIENDRPEPEPMRVPKGYSQKEGIWVVSATKDAVIHAKGKRKVSEVQENIAAPPDIVTTVIPFAEDY